MIFEFYKNVISLAISVTKSVTNRIISLVHPISTGVPEAFPARKYILAAEMRCAGNTGPWNRLAGGHAPVFSLFTYFRNRW
ncbi:MAG: hypothetical protein WC586_06430 [Methanoregula sp.]